MRNLVKAPARYANREYRSSSRRSAAEDAPGVRTGLAVAAVVQRHPFGVGPRGVAENVHWWMRCINDVTGHGSMVEAVAASTAQQPGCSAARR